MSNAPIFEWDPDKAQLNFRKHGISFEDARPVFRDVFSIEWLDETSSDEEERWIAVGMSQGSAPRGRLYRTRRSAQDNFGSQGR